MFGISARPAGLYRKLVTGDDLDSLLKQFVSRGDGRSIQTAMCAPQRRYDRHKNLMDVFYKVPRSNYQRVLQHSGKSDSTQTIELRAG